MNRFAKLILAAAVFVSPISCHGADFIWPHLDQIWRSYLGKDVDYNEFYRVTIYKINSPIVLFGIFTGSKGNRIAWAHSEYENSTRRSVISNKVADDGEAIEEIVIRLRELTVNGPPPGQPGLDGFRIVVEVITKDENEPPTVFRWRKSELTPNVKSENIEEQIVAVWNELPNIKKFP